MRSLLLNPSIPEIGVLRPGTRLGLCSSPFCLLEFAHINVMGGDEVEQLEGNRMRESQEIGQMM